VQKLTGGAIASIKALLAAVGGALLTLGGPARAQDQGLEVRLSGQINRAVMHVDDGAQSDVFHVDNENSSTRFRLAGSAPLAPGLKAGVLWEMEFQSNASDTVNFANRESKATLEERHIDVFFEHRFGKLSLGQGSGAADNAIQVDLSGTAVAHYSNVPNIGGAFAFRTSAGAAGPNIAQTISNQDFESRYDRLRYDTPSFGGLRLVGSHGTKDSRDVAEVALWYASDLGAIGRLAAAVGHSSQDAATAPGSIKDKVIGGSVSWLHPAGFNATFAMSERDVAAGRKGKFSYFKLGYKFGKHAISGDYAIGEDQAAAGDEGKAMGLAYVYTPIGWAEIYAAYERHSLERTAMVFEDIDTFLIGTRLKF
jgi:predicted porin